MAADVAFSDTATGHIERRFDHYENKGYVDAARNLAVVIAGAIRRMQGISGPTYQEPRPYPGLARYGWDWLIEGGYWFGFIPGSTSIVMAVFHGTADIPGLIRLDYGEPS